MNNKNINTNNNDTDWIKLFNNIENKDLFNLVSSINSNLDLAKQTLIEMAVYEDDLWPAIDEAGQQEYRIKNTIEYVKKINIPQKHKRKIIELLTEDLKDNKELYPNNK